MNLHALVSPIISMVNPSTIATYQQSTGSTTAADGSRTPSYADPVDVTVQIQMLTWKDLQQLQGINLNGERRAIYVSGDWQGVARPRFRGGDLITLPTGETWLVVQVLENWFETSGWAKVAATLQKDA